MQKNIIFQTCTKTPKSICSEYLVLLLILCKQLKILQCEVFPEFIVLPLDTESHSFSICLRRPNHTIYVMRVWCILTCINCKWKTKRICIHLICFKYENRASPFFSRSGLIDYKMFQLLRTSNETAWKKNLIVPVIFLNPQYTERKHHKFGKHLPMIIYFLRVGSNSSFCSKLTHQSDLCVSRWCPSDQYQDYAT